MNRFCLGYPFLETRAATEEDTEHLRSLEKTVTRQLVWWRTIMWLCVAGGVLAIPSSISSGEDHWMMFVFAQIFVFPPFWDARRRVRLLAKSLPLETLDVYGDPESDLTVTVHPVTGLIVRRGQRYTYSVVIAAVQTVSPPPPGRDRNGMFPALRFNGSNPDIDFRHLSEPELVELRTLTRALWKRIPTGDLWVCVFVSLFLLAVELDPTEPSYLHGAIAAPLAYLIFFSIWRIQPVFKLSRDCRHGMVAKVLCEGQMIEVLPLSGLIWSESGSPSGIRSAPTETRVL